jgi:hypothetical protein
LWLLGRIRECLLHAGSFRSHVLFQAMRQFHAFMQDGQDADPTVRELAEEKMVMAKAAAKHAMETMLLHRTPKGLS